MIDRVIRAWMDENDEYGAVYIVLVLCYSTRVLEYCNTVQTDVSKRSYNT